MRKRPSLKKGDLVRLHKNKGAGDQIFKVISMSIPRDEARKLSRSGTPTNRTSSEGFVQVTVRDKNGCIFCFKRRELWRVPNQPKKKGTPLLNPETFTTRYA